jgi:DNA-binding XRE family transcriptional regulator
MTPEEAFGKVLREVRHEHSLSQEELGFESSYHRTYISLLERGSVCVSYFEGEEEVIA